MAGSLWLCLLPGGAAATSLRHASQPSDATAESGRAELSAAGTIPGTWRLSPLVLDGAEVTNVRGARIHWDPVEMGYQRCGLARKPSRQYLSLIERWLLHKKLDPFGIGSYASTPPLWLQSGALVFWSEVSVPGKEKLQWGLFSWSDAGLQLLSLEGDRAFEGRPSPLATQGKGLHLYRHWHARAGKLAGPRQQTTMHSDGLVVYLSAYQGVNEFNRSVLAWDGETLENVLPRGQSVAVGGSRCTVNDAAVLDVLADGSLLLYSELEKPCRSGWFRRRGSSLAPLSQTGQALPGKPGTKIARLWGRPFVAQENLVGWYQVKGEGAGLFRVGNDRGRALLVAGQPNPADPARKISGVSNFRAGSLDEILIRAQYSGGKTREQLLLYAGGTLQEVAHWRDKFPKQYRFLSLDPVTVLVVAASEDLDELEELLMWRQRQGLQNLTAEVPHTSVWLRPAPGAFPGVLVDLGQPVPTEVEREVTSGKLGVTRLPERFSFGPPKSLYLSADGTSPRLREPPAFSVTPPRTVTLADVVAWPHPGLVIVQLEDGFYRLQGATAP